MSRISTTISFKEDLMSCYYTLVMFEDNATAAEWMDLVGRGVGEGMGCEDTTF